ncbi:MAG TPA: NAD(P)/FAD-dependent oxidoreductase [Methylomirabilota bacterium]|nr:NAD(P)/FAD-dependent oxidoreductase [Methylomirabilota bacterium]
MRERHETAIVGGGQAALALSYHLGRLGREHVILERARLAERWRTERWDSLRFQFPSWSIRLPGLDYAGDEPDGFASRDEVVAFIERYREIIRAPVRTGVRVDRVGRIERTGSLRVETTVGELVADHVVIATGPYQEPVVPRTSAALPAGVVQVHSRDYRNPDRLPPGAVLVVGSGASGCQIVEDLLAAGRTVYLSVGRHRRYPRRYRGRDMFWWLEQMGALDQTLEERPEARDRPNPLVTGVGGGHEIDLGDYAAAGVTLLGHLRAAAGSRLWLAGDLEERLAEGDEGVRVFRESVDTYVARTGLVAPEDAPAAGLERPRAPSPERLDLSAAHVTAVIWATGFRRDFGWIEAPVFDDRGEPVHRRGVTACPGLYFLGLPWLYTLGSSVLCGVGRDAEHLADCIAARVECHAARRA